MSNKKILFVDEFKINTELNQLILAGPNCQAVLNELQTNFPDVPCDTASVLSDCIDLAGAQYVDIALEKKLATVELQGISGLKLSPAKALAIMDKPSTTILKTLCDQARPYAHYCREHYTLKKGKVTLNDSAQRDLRDRLTIFCNDANEEKLLADKQLLEVAMTAFELSLRKCRGYGLPENFTLRQLFQFPEQGSNDPAKVQFSFMQSLSTDISRHRSLMAEQERLKN